MNTIQIKNGKFSDGTSVSNIVVPLITGPSKNNNKLQGCYFVTVDTSGVNVANRRKNARVFFEDLNDIILSDTKDIIATVDNEAAISSVAVFPVHERTDAEIFEDIKDRFDVLDMMTEGVVDGHIRALVVCGSPGTGKSFSVESLLGASDRKVTRIKGTMSTICLFLSLWEAREEGSVVLIDDADGVLQDIDSMNLLKAAMDTSKRRIVSYQKLSTFLDDQGIPREFDFNGSVIFLSNVNFNREVERQTKMGPHLAAFVSRAHVVDVTLNTLREKLIRVMMVTDTADFRRFHKISQEDAADISMWVLEHGERLREVSIRTMKKVADLVKSHPNHWRKIARVTLCK